MPSEVTVTRLVSECESGLETVKGLLTRNIASSIPMLDDLKRQLFLFPRNGRMKNALKGIPRRTVFLAAVITMAAEAHARRPV